MRDHAPSLRVAQHTRQRRVDALDGRGPALLLDDLVIDELDEVLGPDAGDADVTEPCLDVPDAAAVDGDRVRPRGRVLFLAVQPMLGGLAHRLARNALQFAEGAFRGASVVPEGGVPVLTADPGADVPLAGTGVPSRFRVFARLREGGHVAVDRLGGRENTILMLVLGASSKELVPSHFGLEQGFSGFAGAVRGGNP